MTKVKIPKIVKSLAKAVLNEDGHEVVSDKPVSMPLGFTRPPTLHEQIQRAIRQEMSARAVAEGQESFEDADDFDIGDDFDPESPYEMIFDPAVGQDVPRAVAGITPMQEEVPLEQKTPLEEQLSLPSSPPPAEKGGQETAQGQETANRGETAQQPTGA